MRVESAGNGTGGDERGRNRGQVWGRVTYEHKGQLAGVGTAQGGKRFNSLGRGQKGRLLGEDERGGSRDR